jgi:hypothetical protein
MPRFTPGCRSGVFPRRKSYAEGHCETTGRAAGGRTDCGDSRNADAQNQQTATPIKHLVVIFQENVSFDHYFGT